MSHEALKAELEQKLTELQSRLASIKKDVTQSHSGDSAEQAQERENDEVVDAIGNETAQSIRVIQAALSRIEDGSYGLCDNCGKEIGEARLAAVPEASMWGSSNRAIDVLQVGPFFEHNLLCPESEIGFEVGRQKQ